MILEPYQHNIKVGAREEFAKGNKWVFVQAPTRSGKTVIFSSIIADFLEVSKKDVLVLVHDQKILRQIKKTLYQGFNISAQEITAKTKNVQKASFFGECRVFVAMVETINNRLRLETFRYEMKDIGFIIADEAHLSNFKKIYTHELFIDKLRLGFSATPISADKKDHLYPRYFTSIVIGPSVKELIEVNRQKPSRGVVQDITYVLDQVPDKDSLKLGVDGDYDKDDVGDKLSGKRQIQNTINAIIKHAYGKKLICFNSNKAHSKQVCAEMLLAGLNARHMDSDSSDEWKEECLAWFHKTPGAILCNVGMTTTGFDEPSCEGTVLNRLTKSISLDKQMRARGGTPFIFPDGRHKEYHIVLDMCNNTALHGEWSDDVDWRNLFLNPKYSTPGVAPKKQCDCGAINSASARICVVCEKPFDFAVPTEDTVEKSMKLISKDINIAHTVDIFSSRGEYAAMWDIIRQVAFLARKKLQQEDEQEFEYLIEQEDFDDIFLEAQMKIKEWRKYIGKKTIEISYESVKANMKQKLEQYGFILNVKEEGIVVGKSTKL